MTELSLLKWAEERHKYWWQHLLTYGHYSTKFDKSLPEIIFYSSDTGTAGKANTVWCKYNINYLLCVKEKYDSTIAHELCHTFVSRLQQYDYFLKRSNGGHCSLWIYMYRHVCNFSEEGLGHCYPKFTSKEPIIVLVKQFFELKELEKELL